MTDLRTYLEQTGEKRSDFASRVETTPATISRLCDGSMRPGLDLAHRLEKATSGKVKTEVWLSAAPRAA